MDREAAKREFSKFMIDEKLNSNQINFVNNIIDYIVKNGSIGKEVLQEFPFNKNGGVLKLFDNKLDLARKIISVVDKINDRLVVIRNNIF